MTAPLICRFCGKDNRLSKEERFKRISQGLRKSKKKLGAPRRIDPNEVMRLLKAGNSLNNTAHLLGITKRRVCQIKRELSAKLTGEKK